jgi:hypothetical protein
MAAVDSGGASADAGGTVSVLKHRRGKPGEGVRHGWLSLEGKDGPCLGFPVFGLISSLQIPSTMAGSLQFPVVLIPVPAQAG